MTLNCHPYLRFMRGKASCHEASLSLWLQIAASRKVDGSDLCLLETDRQTGRQRRRQRQRERENKTTVQTCPGLTQF